MQHNQPFRLLLAFDSDCDATPHGQKNRSSSPFSAFSNASERIMTIYDVLDALKRHLCEQFTTLQTNACVHFSSLALI
jgi:hypothetical protein